MITIVIPTRNREEHLMRLCGSINEQTLRPSEVIIVDSSDDNAYQSKLQLHFRELKMRWIASIPSVCVQRNLGISAAETSWVLLCDDDIELPANYIETLNKYIADNPICGCVTGCWLQLEGNQWQMEYGPRSIFQLTWDFIFQLSVWGSVNKFRTNLFNRWLVTYISNWYKCKGNTFTKAGWPLITNWEQDVIETVIYSLGSSLVRKDWLLQCRFDETLDPGGIGDNYGVAIRFPQHKAIHIIKTLPVKHHRAPENRLRKLISYYRRVLALDYFLQQSSSYSKKRLWLIWSLVGNTLQYFFNRKFQFARVTMKLIFMILLAKNPYVMARMNRQIINQPMP